MTWLRKDEDGAAAEIADIERVMAEEAALTSGLSIMDMFRNPIDRRRTMISVVAVNTQAASGAFFMIAYGTYFFEMANVGKPFENTCILTGVGVIAILINSAIITKYGRRRVMLVGGLIFCGLFQLIVAAAYTAGGDTPKAGKVLVAMSVLYIVSYNGMISTYAWLAGGEIPSQRLRSYTFGLAASLGFLGAWLAAFTAPYFINPAALNWGPKYVLPFFPSSLLGTTRTNKFVPDTDTFGAHPAGSPPSGASSTFPKSKTARSRKFRKCSRPGFRLASSVLMSALPMPLFTARPRRLLLRRLCSMIPRLRLRLLCMSSKCND